MEITIITPTTGKPSLLKLIESIKKNKKNISIHHLLIWDKYRDGPFLESTEEDNYILDSIFLNKNVVKKESPGSPLRAIGLMAAQTELVTFADDDVFWDDNHLSSMIDMMKNKKWGFCKRKIFFNDEFLGIDEFESVGEKAKTPYKMVDNNCMIFKRIYGSNAAIFYRETKNYNDDRLMYNFLKNNAGVPGETGIASVNQTCPERLYNFFKKNCTK